MQALGNKGKGPGRLKGAMATDEGFRVLSNENLDGMKVWSCQEAGTSTISTEEGTGRVAVSVFLGTLAGFRNGEGKQLGTLYCAVVVPDFWNPCKAQAVARMIRESKRFQVRIPHGSNTLRNVLSFSWLIYWNQKTQFQVSALSVVLGDSGMLFLPASVFPPVKNRQHQYLSHGVLRI